MRDQIQKESNAKAKIDALHPTETQEQEKYRPPLHMLGFIMAMRQVSQNDLISRRI